MEIRTDDMLSAEQRKQILENVMSHYGYFTQADFARKLGVSTQNLNSWFIRGTYNVELLAVKCPEISGDYLLTGELPMLKSERSGCFPQGTEPMPEDLHKAVAAIVAEQKMTAKAQQQADKLLGVLHTLANSVRAFSKAFSEEGQEQ